jgi:hypothetical protein
VIAMLAAMLYHLPRPRHGRPGRITSGAGASWAESVQSTGISAPEAAEYFLE